MADFIATFATDQHKMQVKFDSDNGAKVDFGEVQTVGVGGELYKGDYAVTPKVDKQSLPTKGKLLVDDVTIHAIPIFRTTNTSGGNTVYIAKET